MKKTLKIDESFRYARPYSGKHEFVDGIRNHFFVTHMPDMPMVTLESGINCPAKVSSSDGERTPAILVSSSPHKIGSAETPWQDFFDVDNGHIRYYGDNKEPGRDPGEAVGNKALLLQHRLHQSITAKERHLSSSTSR